MNLICTFICFHLLSVRYLVIGYGMALRSNTIYRLYHNI
nr:MAG TPA: hypothetical protein [Caudoviricetes sp.]